MQPEEKERATAAFLRSYMEALIGDWEHLEAIGERERHTKAHTSTNCGT